VNTIRFIASISAHPAFRCARLCLLIAGVVLLAGCAAHPRGEPGIACQRIDGPAIDRLFDDWNDAVRRRDVDAVVDLYAERSVLLPTLSRTPRITREQKADYFEEFLDLHPSGTINTTMKFSDCNIAVNAGTYTFSFPPPKPATKARYTYTYGWDARQRAWLITSHHSSAEPQNPREPPHARH
jgi:uncharacterized protein (TIGR02246 family)